MKVELSANKASEVDADLLVIPVNEGSETGGAVRELEPELRRSVASRIEKTKFKAEAGNTLRLQGDDRDLLLVGLGKRRDAESRRRAAAKGRAAAASTYAADVAVCLSGAGAAKQVASVIEGFVLAGYRFDKYRGDRKDSYKGPERLVVSASGLKKDAASRRVVEKVLCACDAVVFARDLINEMSSVKTPSFLVKTARNIARESKLRCDVWQGDRLKKERLNGILAVSAGSKEPGAFVKMVYKPERKARATVAVVGKGITFDSGGLSLKPAKSMEWMKQDMSGAAAVLALMKALPTFAPAVEVRGYVATAENMPGAGAQKPGDIITYRNGKSAEVLNTDAEGRLVLADALCVAAEGEPDCIIDLATLTGACMVALGNRVAGVMGNDQGLVNRLIKHGEESGEPLWQLPLVEDYMSDIKSNIADVKNIGSGYGGTITAAMFLQQFVGDRKWAHLDIAGPAFAEKPFPYAPRGGTGFGVRTLLSYICAL
ncbi:MAG: leucyl aminopeptidase [Candidatus Binatia bacterium]